MDELKSGERDEDELSPEFRDGWDFVAGSDGRLDWFFVTCVIIVGIIVVLRLLGII